MVGLLQITTRGVVYKLMGPLRLIVIKILLPSPFHKSVFVVSWGAVVPNIVMMFKMQHVVTLDRRMLWHSVPRVCPVIF